MKKDYLSRLNINHFLTNLFATLVVLCMTAFAVQAQVNATVVVTAPASVAGDYDARQSNAPGLAMEVSGPVVLGVDTSGTTATACGGVTVDLTGAIALIDRGGCTFGEKVANAAAAGAIAALVCNSNDAQPNKAIVMGTDGATIPSVMISYGDCQTIRAELDNGLMITLSPTARDFVAGEVCAEAIEISAGVHTVTADAFDSGYGAVFGGAGNAIWYSYTPSTNALVTVTSCDLTMVDTRVIIMGGECETASTAGFINFNDDCADDIFSSEVSFLAEAGTRYFIYWDDFWSSEGFDFEIVEGELPEVEVTFGVDMTNETVSGDGVSMVYAGPGAAGLGDVTVLALADDDGDNIWTVTAMLTALDTIGYAFVNGTVSPPDAPAVEEVPEACGLPSGFGFNIRPLIVNTDQPIDAGVFCFGTCSAECPPPFTCDDPFIIINDDIEALAPGDANGQTAWWGAWPGGAVGGEVSSEQAFSGTQSIKVVGGGNQDVLLNFGDRVDGHYVIRWDMYIPEGSNGYFNLQHLAPTSSAGFWGFECYLENGAGRLELYDGSPNHAFEFPFDAWFPVYIIVDIDNDIARMIVNEHYVDQWQFSTGANAAASVNQLNSINFYPADASYLFYVDDVNFWQIPSADDGKYCYTSTPVDVGTHTIAGVSCYGGGYHLSGSSGFASAWYTYTPSEDGVITVSSCDGDSDSRAWIFRGDCDNLTVVGMNDDRCEQSNGDPYASYKEAYVEAGTTYYIMWDNRWDAVSFKWDLGFSSDAPAEAAFCQSAQVVEPGLIDLGAFVGEASVAGDGLFGLCSSSVSCPGGYTGSNWYSYTPEAEGTVNISSCGSGTDTYVFVYTGTCGDYNSLELIASSEDDCDLASIIEGLEVMAGTTYYIEWIDDRSANPFTWELNYIAPITCEEPGILIQDDIEGLALGDASGQAPWWATWPGGSAGGEVTDEQALDGAQSIKISGDISGQDALFVLGDISSGHYIIRWDMYIPEGSNAYFNLQHLAPTSTAGFWGLECFFDNGAGRLELYDGSPTKAFEYPFDLWFPVFIFVDLDNDIARMTINDYHVEQWQFSTGANAAAAVNRLNSINFYPTDASYLFYVDNANFWRIPRPTEGKYCYTASPVDVGSHTIAGIECYGAAWDLGIGTGNAINGGLGAEWYTYTPSSDGVMTLSSCGGDSDSRVWVFSGDCDNLAVVRMNDDRCEQSNGDPYASYKEVFVEAGTTYYIMWDDRWGNESFKWDLDFSSDAPAEAAFCQSAQVVEPGEIVVDAFVGESSVAGDDLYDICTSSDGCPAGYSGSNWYSFTPEGDGTVTISSCDSDTDTYVFVYIGTCGDYNSLQLIASSEDDCGASGLASLIEGLEVTAGTTYYIEWIDEDSADPFIWLLDLMVNADEAALQQGVKVFPNPASDLLNVRVDLPEAADNLAVRMVNTFGQVVSERYYGALQTSNIELDVSNLPAGMYLIQVVDGTAQYTQSVIIE